MAMQTQEFILMHAETDSRSQTRGQGAVTQRLASPSSCPAPYTLGAG